MLTTYLSKQHHHLRLLKNTQALVMRQRQFRTYSQMPFIYQSEEEKPKGFEKFFKKKDNEKKSTKEKEEDKNEKKQNDDDDEISEPEEEEKEEEKEKTDDRNKI